MPTVPADRFGIAVTSTLAWPLLKSAAALLTELADGEDAGPSRPGGLPEPFAEPQPEPMPSPFGPALY